MGDGWRRTTLGEAVQVTMGRQRSPKHATGEHLLPYLRAANVKDGRLELDDVLQMNFSPAEQELFALRPGDVLVTEGCGSIGQIGAAARWNGEFEGTVCFQNTLLRLRALDGVTDPGFVEVWARHAFASGLFAAVASGTNIFHIGATRANEIPVLLPPLKAQRRLVDLMRHVESLVAAAERERLAAEEMWCAIVGSVRADPVPLGGLSTIKGGKRLPKGTPWSLVPTSHPYVRVTDFDVGSVGISNLEFVPDEVWPLISRYVVSAGDVLVSIAGSIGLIADVSAELAGANLTENAALIRADQSRLDPDFLAALLRSARGQAEIARLTVGTTQKKLALFRIGLIEIPLPPLSVQRDIGKIYRTALDVAAAARRTRDAVERGSGALLAELLSARHDIPESYDALLEHAS